MISVIVAASQNGVIGKDNKLLWHIPEDLKRFKSLTMGKPLIMGRKTYESIIGYLGKPLPGRISIVITNNPDFTVPDGHFAAHSLEEALKIAATITTDEVFCIGGAQIYAQILPVAQKIYLTVVEKDYEGEAFFPMPMPDDWRKTSEERVQSKDAPAYRFEVWEKSCVNFLCNIVNKVCAN